MSKNQRSNRQKAFLFATAFFRKFPAFPYLIKWLCIGVPIGLAVGSASAGFLITLDRATHFRESHQWIIVLLPIGGLLVGLLYHYYGKDVESGNNLLIDTIHKPQKLIPFRMAPLVYIGTIVTHFFGGSAGREGTALQMAGAIADQFIRPFKLSSEDRSVLIISALAAGFGSVFGTPLAGAVFALEVILIGQLRYKAIFPAFVAAILADWITHLWQAKHTQYFIKFIPDVDILALLYSLAAGIAFGICAATFVKIIHWAAGQFRSRIAFAPMRPFVGGIIVLLAVLAVGTTKFLGLGIPTILQSFEQQLPPYDFAIKMAFTIITLASGFKGGEVTPLFFIGAVLGSALSVIIPLPVALLAGMGFVAVFAGATNTPLACILMGIELFGTNCGIYVAIACVVSYLFSGHNSIYSKQRIGEPKHVRFSHYSGKSISRQD